MGAQKNSFDNIFQFNNSEIMIKNIVLNEGNFLGFRNLFNSNMTSPFRLNVINHKTLGNFRVIPGITEITLICQILDYFNQNISINSTSKIKAVKFENDKFIEILNNEIFIDGLTNSVVLNGNFY